MAGAHVGRPRGKDGSPQSNNNKDKKKETRRQKEETGERTAPAR
jgi:hypothetical protein